MSAIVIPNPDFTTDLSGWHINAPGGSSVVWAPTGGHGTPGVARFTSSSDGNDGGISLDPPAPVTAGQTINATCWGKLDQGSPGSSMQIALVWVSDQGVHLGHTSGTLIRRNSAGANWRQLSVSGTAPANAAGVAIAVFCNAGTGSTVQLIDEFRWTHALPDVSLLYPTATTYPAANPVPFRINTQSLAGITSVTYYAENTSTSTVTTVGTSTEAPWGVNAANLPAGPYIARASVTLSNSVVLNSNQVNFTVGAPVPLPTREFKASNAYAYLVAQNFSGLSGSIPPTAQIVGMETVVDYYVEALILSKDIGVTDPETARYSAAFDMVPTATFETVLLQEDGDTYSSIGSASTSQVEINRSDYTVIEDGTSGDKRWTVLRGADKKVTIGKEDSVHGMTSMPAADIASKGLGVRFYPNLGPKPDYADDGEACFRVHIDKLRVQIYFDAGSVEYYFASPDRNDIIKGTLASYTVLSGDFSSADAKGVYQLLPELEVVSGTQTWIGNDWTIHAAFPPDDDNQIGLVGIIEGEPEVGMKYNALPTQQQVKDNRSRYQFITENFYGDPELNSMYGVHGLERAFAYNGDYFYKIYTQADPVKDSPRSVANHHGHLALGFNGGRVDISVVGEPYNFDGAMGASSWAFGDKVVGLLPLSGTILGVFGAKSIWGISGTTVDNFATQVVSPNIGAIEYTICDMGFPVYANAYGIYTLSQTQQYGDYLGQPMSRDVSPWLRPRLLRKATSDKEVVCAFPVRSKNQYRLCFSDGYVSTMTLNGQQMPTFSFQKYFYQVPQEVGGNVFDQGAELSNEWWG